MWMMGTEAFLLGIKIVVSLLHLGEVILSLKPGLHCFAHLKDADRGHPGSWSPGCGGGVPPQPTALLPRPLRKATIDVKASKPAERGCVNAKAQERAQSELWAAVSLAPEICLQGSSLCFYDTIQMAANFTSFFCGRHIFQVWFHFTVYPNCLGQQSLPNREGHAVHAMQ